MVRNKNHAFKKSDRFPFGLYNLKSVQKSASILPQILFVCPVSIYLLIGAIFVDTGRNFENSKKIIIDGFYDGKIKNILEKYQTDMNSNLGHHFKKKL